MDTSVTPVVTVNVRLAVAFCAGVLESVTLKVSGVLLTAAVGVPLITPELLNVKPAGSDPDVNDQLYGVVPPVPAKACE